MNKLRKEIENAINRHSAENVSNTPDFILAHFLTDCLKAFDTAVTQRELWRDGGRTFAQQSNAAELLPPVAKDVDDDAWVKGAQIP